MTRRRFYPLVLALVGSIALGGWVMRRFLETLPSYQKFEEYQPSLTTRVYDVQGELIAELSIEKRALLTLSHIPVDMQNAVLAIEDSRFFEHWGVSVRGMMRAAVANFKAGRIVQGGSTLTQQLAKLIFLSPEKKIIRKIKEMILAMQMERNLSKEEIFQFYLNQIYFGHGAYGVMAAAHVYFGKEVQELSLSECALLAGLIKYPGGYSPFRHPKRAERRRRLVLRRMVDEGFITPDEMKKAMEVPIPTERPAMTGIQAPHFVEHVRRQLEPKFGYNTLWRGGLKIHTTLDMGMQQAAEEEMETALSAFDEKALVEWERRLAEDMEAGIEPPSVSTNPPSKIQGSFLVLDVRSGAIQVMIGGRSGGGPSDFNRTVQARRQPGSTFKPFVWAAALNAGLTGVSLVEDSPLAYYYDGRDWRLLEGATDQYAINLATSVFADSEDFKVWVPNNFDNKFLGVVTLRRALALSRNVASIRIVQHIGPPGVVELAHKVGIRSRLAPVLSLGLGASVVSSLELANAFQTFANGGIHVRPYSVLRVEDSRGRLRQRHVPKEEEAISPQLAYLVTHLLKVVVEGGTGRRARALKRPLAGKTGTTNDNRDMWFVGYTPDLLAVGWMGYDDDTTLGRKLGSSSTLVPWWTEIMKRVLKDYPKRDFPVPDDVLFLKVDAETGHLALPTCPRQTLQAFLKGTEPTRYCPYDHTQPLELTADFSVSGDMRGAFVDPEAELYPVGDDEEYLPPLPSDDELEELSDTDF
ncbi:penicillin-binding protein 1A [Elusimicrobiota bacterium]